MDIIFITLGDIKSQEIISYAFNKNRDKKEKSRLLAVCSRGKQLLAPHIRDWSNNLVSEPQDVNMVSQTFHTSLYKQNLPLIEAVRTTFLMAQSSLF